MPDTKISWADKSWNPITGCTKVSQGCKNCYAEAISVRYPASHAGPGVPFSAVRVHPEKLGEPGRWKDARVVFVCSRSDLFHEALSSEEILMVFHAMERADHHAYVILTKRPGRALSFFEWCAWNSGLSKMPEAPIWFGVSAEDHQRTLLRATTLDQIPARHRWLSLEPLLGEIDLGLVFHRMKIDGVVVGGESGPGHRVMDLRWLERIVEQCRQEGVPCYVKQDSGRFPDRQGRIPDNLWIRDRFWIPPKRKTLADQQGSLY